MVSIRIRDKEIEDKLKDLSISLTKNINEKKYYQSRKLPYSKTIEWMLERLEKNGLI